MNRILHNTAIYDNPNKVIFFISITKTAKLKKITFSILWADIVETSCLVLFYFGCSNYRYNDTGESQESEESYKPARVKEVHSKLHSFQLLI